MFGKNRVSENSQMVELPYVYVASHTRDRPAVPAALSWVTPFWVIARYGLLRKITNVQYTFSTSNFRVARSLKGTAKLRTCSSVRKTLATKHRRSAASKPIWENKRQTAARQAAPTRTLTFMVLFCPSVVTVPLRFVDCTNNERSDPSLNHESRQMFSTIQKPFYPRASTQRTSSVYSKGRDIANCVKLIFIIHRLFLIRDHDNSGM